MKKTNKGLIILSIMMITIFSSGCIIPVLPNVIKIENETNFNNSSSMSKNGNKTFSNGGISFTYPGDWTEDYMTPKQEPGSSYENLGMFITPDGCSFIIDRSAVLYSGENSIEKYKNATKKMMEDAGALTLSENTKTINGLKIYEIYLKQPYGNDRTMYIITGKGQIMYDIQLNGNEKTLKKYSSALNQVESTIKIE